MKRMLKYKVLAQYHSLGTEFKKKKHDKGSFSQSVKELFVPADLKSARATFGGVLW